MCHVRFDEFHTLSRRLVGSCSSLGHGGGDSGRRGGGGRSLPKFDNPILARCENHVMLGAVDRARDDGSVGVGDLVVLRRGDGMNCILIA